MKRAIGYCENLGGATKTPCRDFGKGVFLLNYGSYFYCAGCTEAGHIEEERGTLSGKGLPVKEVRVEFNFELGNRNYREIAIVRDDSLWESGRTYTLKSPLIRTEKRALIVAESILANLQLTVNVDDDKIPNTTETVLSFDDSREDFFASLRRLQDGWKSSNLCKNK